MRPKQPHRKYLDLSKSLTFLGTSGKTVTIIDGLDILKPLRFYGPVNVTIEGFTVQNGNFGGGGALTATDGAQVWLEDCVFRDNYASGGGGAIYSRIGAHLRVNNCEFLNNSGGDGGAGAVVYNARMTVTNCLFDGNTAEGYAGVFTTHESTLDVSNCLFVNNVATQLCGVLFYSETGGTVTNNTFYNNVCGGGAAADIYLLESPPTLITHNIFADTQSGFGVSYVRSSIGYRACNLFWNNALGEVSGDALVPSEIVDDPEFCGPMMGNFLLSESSSAAPANNSCAALIGAYTVGCGPVAVEETTWGRIKSMYVDD